MLKNIFFENTLVKLFPYLSVAMVSLIARIMGPIWGREDPGGTHVSPMNFAI